MIKIIRDTIHIKELQELASKEFGDMVKAVVEVEQNIMAIGGELHADEEMLLIEQEGAKRENTWGINIYPYKRGEEFIEFDSMINLKPGFGNRSRGIEDGKVQGKIKEIVHQLVKE